MANVDPKTGKIQPGPYAHTNNGNSAPRIEKLDVNNKREPKGIKTVTQQLKKAR